MPLASDRSASLHRQKMVEAEKKAEARKRRLSLPKTIRSTTHVNAAKVEHRRKSRRLSERFKENELPESPPQGPTPYHKVVQERGGEVSPRLTRSQKKVKQVSKHERRGSGMVLSFSPPNQELNVRREKDRIEESDRGWAQRVQHARDNGQLLVYSPTNRPLHMRDNDRESLANEMKGIRALIESNSAAASSSQQHELEKAKMESSVLAATNAKLEEDKDRMEKELVAANKTFNEEKNAFLVETTRLKSQIEAVSKDSETRLDTLTFEKNKLEGTIKSLQVEKLELVKRTTELDQQVEIGKEKLADAREKLQALKEHNENEANSLQQSTEGLQKANQELSEEMAKVHQECDLLKLKIAEYERQVARYEEETIPNLEAKRDETFSRLESQTLLVHELKSSLERVEQEKSRLTSQVDDLHAANEKERSNFQKLNEESGESIMAQQKEIEDRDASIQSLEQQFHVVQKELKEEKAKNESLQRLEQEIQELESELSSEQSKNEKLETSIANLQEEFEDSTRNLNGTLQETIRNLEDSEQAKLSLQEKLDSALNDMNMVMAANRESEQQSKETSSQVEELQRALALEQEKNRAERERAEHLEREGRKLKAESQNFEKELKATMKERDEARGNMKGFDDREEELYQRLRESNRIRRDLHGRVMQLMGNIRVFVRVRPPLESELHAESQIMEEPGKKKRKRETSLFRFPGVYDRADGQPMAGEDITKNIVELTEPYKDRGGLSERRKKLKFGFDSVFSPEHGQDDVWEATEPLIQSAVDGYNVTLFAYGQTGSGKTFTMLGVPGNEGIISRAIKKLFDAKDELESLSRGATKVELAVELLEVYNEQVRDLLAPNSGPNGRELPLKVTSKEVIGNVVHSTHSHNEVLKVLTLAQGRRCVKSTSSNSESSRSHMLFTIHFSVTTKDGMQRNGKLNVCDLAGSERLDKSGAHHVGGSLLRETQHINKSLSTLSNVIERLQAKDGNVPFRESKLTFLLQNSLRGNSKTLAIVCCNPLPSHYHESLSSLRFAKKVSKVDLKQATANISC